MRIFLTGGTGLIGSHVAEQLRHRGDPVLALVRPGSDTSHLRRIGCDLVYGSVLDPAPGLAARMAGSDAVVHAAALVFQRASRSEFLQSNVQGTEGILRAAAGVTPRVVHLSSVAVYSGLPYEAGIQEHRWRDSDPDRQNAYAASKTISEQVAWHLHTEGAVRLTTIRPSVVYGERDRAAAPILIRYSRLPIVPLLGGGRTRLPLVYAGNVARGILAALDREAAIGRAYNLAFDHPVTAEEIVGLINRDLGREPRTVAIPAALALAGVAMAEKARRLVPFLSPTGLGRVIRSLARDNPYDCDRARRDLDWVGLIPHTDGVRRTMDWWRAGGQSV
jgi:2-alkyl-3-oxoalkanoate reductase